MKNPANQVLHTNVAVVRLKKGGKKFELACYRNKIMNWRSKQETDIAEVLQIDRIFTSVSKGDVAKKADLLVFGDLSEDQIIQEILNKGELQVSDLEREDHLENLKKDVANIIVRMCVNSKDGNQFPVSIILKAMAEAGCKLIPTQSAKKQALEFIRELQAVLPIERAKMRLRVSFERVDQWDRLQASLQEGHAEDFAVERVTERFVEITIQPALYREVNTIVKQDKEFYSGVSIEIQDHQQTLEGEMGALGLGEEVKAGAAGPKGEEEGGSKKKKAVHSLEE